MVAEAAAVVTEKEAAAPEIVPAAAVAETKEENVSDDVAVPDAVGDSAPADGDLSPCEAGRSVPLLKFEGPAERPVLCQEGLDAIMALPGPVCPIAFVGDGRSGKSYLASKLTVDGMFQTDDSDEAVTKGVDCGVIASHPGHILVLDCEGGNNAMSKSHSIVTVVGALMATALIFVTDGKASEAAIEALSRMLEERSLIKCDGTGSLHAQTLFFVVNQSRLRYQEDALEKILSVKKDPESDEMRELIAKAYPQGKRQFYTVPSDHRDEFEERWVKLHEAVREAAGPLKMGKLWMTGPQVVQMLQGIEQALSKHGKVSLPNLHRHVILDGWLKPTVSQVLSSRMDKLCEEFDKGEFAQHKVGVRKGKCMECKEEDKSGWIDPDIEEFFCEDCWRVFSPKVLKCGFCGSFHPWQRGRVEQVLGLWHCMDCLMQLGIEID